MKHFIFWPLYFVKICNSLKLSRLDVQFHIQNPFLENKTSPLTRPRDSQLLRNQYLQASLRTLHPNGTCFAISSTH